MKARVRWLEKRTFAGVSGSGHALVLGGPHEDGPPPGPSPMELVLLGLGGCTAFDVVHILERGREAVDDLVVELEAERAAEDPKVFTAIRLHYVVTGRALSRAKVERAIALSAEKYCSASAMLAKTAAISHDFEIVESAP